MNYAYVVIMAEVSFFLIEQNGKKVNYATLDGNLELILKHFFLY